MNRSEVALAKLRQMLESGSFPVNSQLPPERELAVELNVSRSALRNGMRFLEAEGKIWRHVGKGTFVGSRPVSQSGGLSLISGLTNPAELMEVRLEIEPRIARLAALRATVADISHMQRCLSKSKSATSVKAFDLWDGTLHRAVAEAAHNTLLLALFDAVNAIRTQTIWGQMQEEALSHQSQRLFWGQHKQFVEAIADRDPSLAEKLMRQHIESVRVAMFGSMPEQATAGPEDAARRG